VGTVPDTFSSSAACTFGFFLAQRLPVRWSIALVVTVELCLLAIYRDNLTLNILMLVWPLESVKTWQMGRS
jgi:hypothetical protein